MFKANSISRVAISLFAMVLLGGTAVVAEQKDLAPIPSDAIERMMAKVPKAAKAEPTSKALRQKIRETKALLNAATSEASKGFLKGPRGHSKKMMMEAKASEIDGLRDDVLKRFDASREKMAALGLVDKVKAWDKKKERVRARFLELSSSLKNAGQAKTQNARLRAISDAQETLKTFEAQPGVDEQLPSKPIPTWSFKPILELQQFEFDPSVPKPKYLSKECSPTRNLYAALGDSLLRNPEPTPAEAAVCAYDAADLAANTDVQITQEIRDLAYELEYKPGKIFQFVANEIRFEPYYGSLKGSMGTLVSGAGNSTDQASLLIALLRASNIPARYVKGYAHFENDPRIMAWTGTKSYDAAAKVLLSGGIPTGLGTNIVQFHHVWVETCLPYSHYRGAKADNSGHRWIPLDPSFENKEYQDGIALSLAFDYSSYLSTRTIELPHEAYQEQVADAIISLPPNYANNTLADVPYKGTLIPLEMDVMPISLPYHVPAFLSWGGGISEAETAELPDSHRVKFSATVKNSSDTVLGQVTWTLPEMVLQRTTLGFEGATTGDQTLLDSWRNDGDPESALPCSVNVVPVLRTDGVTTLQGTTSVGICTENNKLDLEVTLAELSNPTLNSVSYTNISAAALHALQAYSFQASDRLLTERAERLVDAVAANPNPNANLDETEGEYLHLVGLKYMRYISDAAKGIGALRGHSGDSGNHLGLTSAKMKVEYIFDQPFAVSRTGWLIDVPGGRSRSRNLTTGDADFDEFVLGGYAMSAYESYVWQENARLDAVSTVRGLQFANENSIEVLDLDSSNWANHSSKFTSNPDSSLNYSTSYVNNLKANYIDQGYTLKIPRSKIQYENWNGAIFVGARDYTGVDGTMSASYIIGGSYAGGYTVSTPQPVGSYNPSTDSGFQSSDPSSTSPVNSTTMSNGSTPQSTYAGDPVNLATGNMYHIERDIVIPGRGGLPFVFERSYNSRDPEEGPMGYGWTHSFNHLLRFEDNNMDSVENAADTDGVTSVVTWIDGSGATKFFGVPSASGAGIPSGTSFVSPSGVYVTAERLGNGSYRLSMKDGLTYTFQNVAGTVGQTAQLTEIQDRNGNTLTLSYNGSNLSLVQDALGRALTFGYTGTHLTSVQDWTGRRTEFRFDPNGNLEQVLNPLALAGTQSPITYTYYTSTDGQGLEHKMKSYTLPRGNGMTFEYYSNGKTFRHTDSLGGSMTFRYNEFRRETVTVDELGRTRFHFFNPQGSLVKIIEPDGSVVKYEFNDPNDQTLRTAQKDPMGLTTTYAYDTNGNLTQITSPSGSTIAYSHYTSFNQPGKIKNRNGNYTLRKYDSSGNLTDVIRLKQGVGASIDPATYTPSPSEIVSWEKQEFDSHGNLTVGTSIRDFATQEGPTTTFTYQPTEAYPSAVTRCGDKDGDGQISDDPCDTATLSYDSLGRLEQGVRGDWEVVSYGYDALGRIKQGTDDNGYLRDYAYDGNGNPVREELIVQGGQSPVLVDQYTATYDLLDRLKSELDAGGNATYYTYDAVGNVLTATDPDNYSVTFEYSNRNRLVKAINQEGKAVTRDFDVLGRVREVTDPNGNSRSFEYYDSTEDGRLKREVDPVGRETLFEYDAQGNVTGVTDNLGRTIRTTYDELNRPVRIVQPDVDPTTGILHPVTTYLYDNLGNLVEIKAGHNDTDPNNPSADVLLTQATYTYDDFGRRLSETDPLSNTWSFAYDVHGNVLQARDPKGQVVERDYDYGGRVREQRGYLYVGDPNPHVSTYTRNALGQIAEAVAPEVDYSYEYDTAHRLKKQTDSRGNKAFEYDYSPGGQLNSLKDSEGRETNYQYDPVGRLTGIWAPDYDYISLSYDAGGRLTEKWYPSQVNTQYAWGADDTLAQIKVRQGPSDTQIIAQHDYTYDQVGNRKTNIEMVAGSTTAYKYNFDALNRLVEVRDNDTDALIESYGYDVFDNRTSVTSGGTTRYSLHDNAHQITEIREGSTSGPLVKAFAYDSNGNIIKKCGGSGASRSANDCSGSTTLALTYDVLNRLNQADKTGLPSETYQYDPQGRRIQKQVGSSFSNYLYEGSRIHAEYGSGWTQASAFYTHGPGVDNPLIHQAGATSQYFHQDGLGSVIAMTDTNGNIQATQGYDAWGNTVSSTGTTPQYGYTGREPDATGLVYYRARYYDPEIGRFTQRDPLGFIAGINQYAMAVNNPVSLVDPYGYAPEAPNAGTKTSYWKELAKAGVELGVGLSPAGVAADIYTLFSGKTITGDEVGWGMRFAGLIPGVSEVKKLGKIGKVGAAIVKSSDETADAVKATRKVEVSASRHPESARHIQDAQSSGHPQTLTIDRGNAAANRRDSLRDVPTKPGLDRDEYPPAMFKEGGEGASVRHINPSDNRGAGSCIGAQCRGLPDGTRVKIEVVE